MMCVSVVPTHNLAEKTHHPHFRQHNEPILKISVIRYCYLSNNFLAHRMRNELMCIPWVERAQEAIVAIVRAYGLLR
jgi:hypothetical protein